MMTSAPHPPPCRWVWPGWWAGLLTEAGNVSFECFDWQALGRGWQQSTRQRTPSSSTTWLDGQWVGGGRRRMCWAVQLAMSAYSDGVIWTFSHAWSCLHPAWSPWSPSVELLALWTALLSDWCRQDGCSHLDRTERCSNISVIKKKKKKWMEILFVCSKINNSLHCIIYQNDRLKPKHFPHSCRLV